ncbi:MAG: hypothetical protein KDA72_18800, partial [Planctomycetales bacterium]|nr:hypothetical protein [Planctomycetales bacterium]
RDIFTQLPYHRSGEAFAQSHANEPVTSDELDHLLPDCWLLANPQHTWTIDAVRRQERKQNAKFPNVACRLASTFGSSVQDALHHTLTIALQGSQHHRQLA